MATEDKSGVLSCKLANGYVDEQSNSFYESIEFKHGSVENALSISLRRTIRVPDNENVSYLPPDMGAFPIYPVSVFADRLPSQITSRGGCFVPIYQREAMWIEFTAREPFAVKVLCGGVNAISGEPATTETLVTIMRRSDLLAKSKSIQDYLVPGPGSETGHQQWLDGISDVDGKVRQFVAMPKGSGYSIEAQITGNDIVCSIQFEVIPTSPAAIADAKRRENERALDFRRHEIIVVKLSSGTLIPIWEPSPGKTWDTTPVDYVRSVIMAFTDSSSKRLMFSGRWLADGETLGDHEIKPGDTLNMYDSVVGGGGGPGCFRPQTPVPIDEALMAIAGGGHIKQAIVKDTYNPDNWDVENCLMFNVNLLPAANFKQLTGLELPPTPVSAKEYKTWGFPFFKIYKEPKSGIHGNFGNLKSVASMDVVKGVKQSTEKEEDITFPVVNLFTSKAASSFRPVAEMEKDVASFNIANF